MIPNLAENCNDTITCASSKIKVISKKIYKLQHSSYNKSFKEFPMEIISFMEDFKKSVARKKVLCRFYFEKKIFFS